MVDDAARRALVSTRWVHVHGDDSEGGAVFRDASGDVPLSRRPKELLEFSDDGTVKKLATGADDRAHEVDRTPWSHKDGKVVFRFGDENQRGAEHHVVEQSADKLIIKQL